jgi:AcrR family transcriptional regulator
MSAEPAARFADAQRGLLRDTILGATDGLLATQSWRAVTMAQVAKAAGVSRQTVYNEFGNRRDLARAYAIWAGEQLLDEVERCVAEHRDDLGGALVAAFTVFLDVGEAHPLVRSLGDSTGSDDLVSALAADRDTPLVDGAVLRLVEIVSGTWPELPPEPVAAACEVLVRLAISHLLLPTSSSTHAAGQVALVLGPLIDQVQAALGTDA